MAFYPAPRRPFPLTASSDGEERFARAGCRILTIVVRGVDHSSAMLGVRP
jgi:hypothetical protein